MNVFSHNTLRGWKHDRRRKSVGISVGSQSTGPHKLALAIRRPGQW